LNDTIVKKKDFAKNFVSLSYAQNLEMKASFLLLPYFLLLHGVSAFASGSSSFNSLSVSELKKLLTERGVDFRDCLEKRDLVERLESTKHLSSATSTGYNFYSTEESRRMATFQRVSPAVAFITTTVRATQRFSLTEMEIPVGTGSGFLWDNQGHIVTNYHVIAGSPGGRSFPQKVKVKLAGMAEASEATVVGVEPEKDLAVLKISARSKSNLPRPLDVGSSSDLQVGQSVLAIGNPFGLDNTLTTGVVSATGRDVQGIGGRPIKGCIQTDAAINPGNSGGPLLDSNGRLIGVNTAIYTGGTSRGNVGIGFAIPVDTVRRVVNQIIRYGKVVRPTLGIQVIDDRIVQNIGMQLRRKLEGVLIAEVLPNSPALSILQPTTMNGDGSINLGDLVTHIDGEKVKQVEDLLSEVEKREEGDSVRLTIVRNGIAKTVEVKLVSRDRLSSARSFDAQVRNNPKYTSIWN
jgi:S1-C subfamily serine protease